MGASYTSHSSVFWVWRRGCWQGVIFLIYSACNPFFKLMVETFPGLVAYSDVGLFALRIGVGVIFLIHGIQKFKMWKAQPSAQMTSGMLSLMKFLSIAETVGAIAILSGFLIQLAAIGLGIIMIGAAHMKMTKWGKKFTGDGGWEFDFILLATCVALIFLGAGAYAI